MDSKELHDLVEAIQQQQSEFDNVEVKTAGSGTPKKLYDSLSALANRPGGGIILFGLDKRQGFKVTGVGDAQRLQEDISNLCADQMEPPLRPEFTFEEIDDETVVALEVFEIPREQKPCYYKPKGLQGGVYIRSGGTDRPMTDYEIFGYVSSRGQPTHDEEIVGDATIDDLDGKLLEQYLDDLRRTRPQASFLNAPRYDLLVRLHVATRDGNTLRPTLGGLLAFG